METWKQSVPGREWWATEQRGLRHLCSLRPSGEWVWYPVGVGRTTEVGESKEKSGGHWRCHHDGKGRVMGRRLPKQKPYKSEKLHGNYDPIINAVVFPVWMWELDHIEGWVLKNWCFWIVGLEKTLENPLDCNEIKPVNPKENQPWIFIGRTDAETESPILWPPNVKSWLIGKDPDAGKDWRQREKRVAEAEVVVWHDWLNGHEFEQTLGDTERQGSLACFNPCSCKEQDMT